MLINEETCLNNSTIILKMLIFSVILLTTKLINIFFRRCLWRHLWWKRNQYGTRWKRGNCPKTKVFKIRWRIYRGWSGQHGPCCNTNSRPTFLNTRPNFSNTRPPKLFNLSAELLIFSWRLQKLGRVFGKLGQGFERLCRMFQNKHSTECFVKESL